MITKVSVKGFRSILDIEDLELGRVNVFIGANGSGKSNILEAIGVLGAAAQGRVRDSELRRRGVRPGVPALFKSAFAAKRRRRTITLSASSSSASYAVSVDNPIKSPQPGWAFLSERVTVGDRQVLGRSPRSRTNVPSDTGLAARASSTGELPMEAHDLLESLAAYCIYSPTTAVLRGTVADEWQREPLGLSGGGLPRSINELVRSRRFRESGAIHDLFDMLEWVEHITAGRGWDEILSPEVPAVRDMIIFSDHWMKARYDRLTAYDASEGALYVLFLAAAAMHPNMPKTFAIDNFDAGMHPRLCRAATRFLVARLSELDDPRQVLLTTHNPLALDGLDLRDDKTRLFTVERDRQGATVCKRVVLDERILASDNPDRALSQLWVMGYLGGVPEVW